MCGRSGQGHPARPNCPKVGGFLQIPQQQAVLPFHAPARTGTLDAPASR